jgi:hypothetical protein
MPNTEISSQYCPALRTTALAAACAMLLATPATATPRDAILSGDMRAATAEVEKLYADHGLSWADWIEWEIGPFTTTYWYYDHTEAKIVAGDMPRPGQADAYWQAFSNVLTDGNWKSSGFFSSAEEALDMARFNQWVLATHESAHAITFRYDYQHTKRYDYHVNCREYHADRLTAAILQDAAKRDPDMARWRARYLELVTEMGASIPDEYKVTQADYAMLEADCKVMDIDQPTPDRMQAYASAYFARYKALLEADLPPLDAVFETHLKARNRAETDAFPVADEWSGHMLETVEENEGVYDYLFNRAKTLEGRAQRAAAFAPDDTLYVAESSSDLDSGQLQIVFGPHDGAFETVAETLNWHRESEAVTLVSIAVYSPDLFFAAFEEEGYHSAVLRFERGRQGWTHRLLVGFDRFGKARAFRAPDGRLLLALSEYKFEDSEETDNSWRVADFDPVSGENISFADLPVVIRHPVGADDEMRLFFSYASMLIRLDEEGKLARVAGNGLDGHADGDIENAEISGINIFQINSNGAMMLDEIPGAYPRQSIRRLTPPVSDK